MSLTEDMRELETAILDAVRRDDYRLAMWLDELHLARYGHGAETARQHLDDWVMPWPETKPYATITATVVSSTTRPEFSIEEDMDV